MNKEKRSHLFKNRHLYAVTDLKKGDSAIFRKAERALRGGVDILQLRSKTLLDNDFYTIGLQLKKIARKHHKLFFINDRAHIAHLLKVDGLHLGQNDLTVALARRVVGNKMLIGKSTHSLKQALDAQKEGPDYIGVGPIFKTPTKPGYGQVGLGLVEKISKQIQLPFVTIGGIDVSNVDQVLARGTRCVAVVRAIFNAKDPEKNSRIIRQKVIQHLKPRKV